MDASYIELGPSNNHRTNVTADDADETREQPMKNGGIMETRTFGTDISYDTRRRYDYDTE